MGMSCSVNSLFSSGDVPSGQVAVLDVTIQGFNDGGSAIFSMWLPRSLSSLTFQPPGRVEEQKLKNVQWKEHIINS